MLVTKLLLQASTNIGKTCQDLYIAMKIAEKIAKNAKETQGNENPFLGKSK